MKFSFLLLIFTFNTYATEMSITMDDFNLREKTLLSPEKRNERILETLKKSEIKGALYVAAKFIESEADKNLLKAWGEAGHMIGNHTFNHIPFDSKVTAEEEIREIIKAEDILKSFSGFKKSFRFPMLTEGDTAEKRDQVRTWLRHQDYTVGSVTIDTSDWYIDQRMREKIAKDPKTDLKKYRSYYLNHLWENAQYYNDLSKRVLGREVKHTLLVHFNLLNAIFLGDALAMFKSRGWKLIDAEEAFKDPAFAKLPNSLPSGQSLIWGLAKETGRFDSVLHYPGEDGEYEKKKMDAAGL
jgi:hypothetical protein